MKAKGKIEPFTRRDLSIPSSKIFINTEEVSPFIRRSQRKRRTLGHVIKRGYRINRNLKKHSLVPSAILFSLFILALIIISSLVKDYLQKPTPSDRLLTPGLSSFPIISTDILPDIGPIKRPVLRITVKKGDDTRMLLSRYGLLPKGSNIAEKIDSILSQKISTDSETKLINEVIRPGQQITVLLSKVGLIDELRIVTKSGKFVRLVYSNTKKNFSLSTKNIPAYEPERVAVGSIETSFAAAAQKAGVPWDIVDDLVDLFSDRVEFKKDFQKGDRFTLIYRDNSTKDGHKLSAGPILAAALEVGKKHLVAVRYVGTDGKPRFFNEQGELIGETFLRYPLKFSRISSYFSESRFHPVLKHSRPHNGVDFAAPIGTPVRTIADGKVTFAGKNGGGGNTIKIKHTDRYETAYLHLSKIDKSIKVGATVSRGQVIGAVGMTGLATGPHLHFSLYDRGVYTDPLKAKLPLTEMLTDGIRVSKTYLDRVLFTMRHYQKLELRNFNWR